MKLTFLLFAFLASGPISIWLNDDLVSDFQLRNQTLIHADIATSDRKCTGMPFIIYSCGFKFKLAGEKQHKNYLFISLGAPDTIRLLKSKQSGVLTSNVGQNYFWNRITAVLLFCSFSLFTAFALLAVLFRRNARPQLQPNNPPATAPLAQGLHNKKSFGQR